MLETNWRWPSITCQLNYRGSLDKAGFGTIKNAKTIASAPYSCLKINKTNSPKVNFSRYLRLRLCFYFHLHFDFSNLNVHIDIHIRVHLHFRSRRSIFISFSFVIKIYF